MSRQNVTKEYNTFIRGIITEASPLTYPENASLDEENFILNRDGSRKRRLGIDYEGSYVKIDTLLAEAVIEGASVSSYKWESVAGNTDLSITVVQIGNKLYFFDLTAATISANALASGTPVVIADSGQTTYQMTDINGVLVVATGATNAVYIEYDSAADTFSQTTISIKIRDLFGIDDGLDVDTRPTTLSTEHKYNIYNQGWTDARINALLVGKAYYPSNADIEYYGKKSDGTGWEQGILVANNFGTTPAPKGKYIIDAFNRSADRQTQSGLSFTSDYDTGNISTLTAHAGRLFYSGINSKVYNPDTRSPNYSGFVFFTKIVEGLSDLEICYQEADPSSEHISDLIDTDGGYIPIPDANNIHKIVSYQDSVVVFADNGVWRIYSAETGFTATDNQLDKISSVGAINAEAVTVAEDVIYYWSTGGIYIITPEQVSGKLISQNISEATVQTLYNDISNIGKMNAVGNYDPTSKKVSWLYNTDSSYTGTTFKNKYNRELIFDTVLGAFYKYKIESLSSNSPYVAGYVTTSAFLSTTVEDLVVSNDDVVTVNGDDVIVSFSVRADNVSTTKYLSIVPGATYSFTFGQYSNTAFVDWYSEDSTGINYNSYLITGYDTSGDTIRIKQVPYIIFHFNRTENGYILDSSGNLVLDRPSSCLVQVRWEWTDSVNSGRWGTAFQAYRLLRNYIPTGISDPFDYGHSVITTKNKLRGKGKCVSLYIYSEEGKDMQLLGWGVSGAMTTIP